MEPSVLVDVRQCILGFKFENQTAVCSISRKCTHHSTAKEAIAKGRVGVGTGITAVVSCAVVSCAVVRVLGDGYGDDSQDDENLKQIIVFTDLYQVYTLRGVGSRGVCK